MDQGTTSPGASGHDFIPPEDWEDFSNDKTDKQPPYKQEPIYEGSYVDDDGLIILARNLNRADSAERGFSNHAHLNPPQDPNNQQSPQNAPYPQLPQYQPTSENCPPYEYGNGFYSPPANYTTQANLTFPNGPPAPQGMQRVEQQPAALVNDPQSAIGTGLPPDTRLSIVSQPEGFGAQPSAIIVQPILAGPPPDYLNFSIFVTVCCCWLIGILAITRSIKCREAIAAGNRRMANHWSIAARKAAYVAVLCGFVVYIIAVVLIGYHTIFKL